jgi:hypothetical protein
VKLPLVIDIDDTQKKSAHEKVIAFCNVYKNTAFTKNHDMQTI